MSKTKGEGRAISEKSSQLIITPEAQKEAREKKLKEEAEWAAKSGPVVVRRKTD